MSSDIFSRKINIEDFDLIYAGAQKNMGPAGTTLYICKKEIFGKSSVPIPTMLDLKIHSDKDSMFNTPPVFPIYASMLNLRWLKRVGGLSYIEEQNEKKSKLIYNQIDNSSLFLGTANKEDRSSMNATFTLTNEGLNETFNKMLVEANINGLKGHRSVGGFRASMYNAMPFESVSILVDIMKELENKKG
jgi:phosphoserine aminotransferase